MSTPLSALGDVAPPSIEWLLCVALIPHILVGAALPRTKIDSPLTPKYQTLRVYLKTGVTLCNESTHILNLA